MERTTASIESEGKACIGKHKYSGKVGMGKEDIVEKGDTDELFVMSSRDDC